MPRKAKDPNPNSVGDFSITLTDFVLDQAIPTDDDPNPTPIFKTFKYEVQVFDQDGNVMELIRGNLEDELPLGQIQNYITSMDFFRNKSADEIINSP